MTSDDISNNALRLARIVLQSDLYMNCAEAKLLTDRLLASGGDRLYWREQKTALSIMTSDDISKQFDEWWNTEGSGLPTLPGEDAEAHVRRICKIAWLAGAIAAYESEVEAAKERIPIPEAIMKIWILKPKSTGDGTPWSPWYDKAFGFVVISGTEQQARELASAEAGDEKGRSWLDANLSTCQELTTDYGSGVVMQDLHFS